MKKTPFNLDAFKKYAANGYLNQLASQAVADAITESRALGLPVDDDLASGKLALVRRPVAASRKKTFAALPASKRAAA